jgi:hypothetical protein
MDNVLISGIFTFTRDRASNCRKKPLMVIKVAASGKWNNEWKGVYKGTMVVLKILN